MQNPTSNQLGLEYASMAFHHMCVLCCLVVQMLDVDQLSEAL